MQALLGQIYRDDNGNYYGKAKQYGRKMGSVYGTWVTRR